MVEETSAKPRQTEQTKPSKEKDKRQKADKTITKEKTLTDKCTSVVTLVHTLDDLSNGTLVLLTPRFHGPTYLTYEWPVPAGYDAPLGEIRRTKS